MDLYLNASEYIQDLKRSSYKVTLGKSYKDMLLTNLHNNAAAVNTGYNNHTNSYNNSYYGYCNGCTTCGPSCCDCNYSCNNSYSQSGYNNHTNTPHTNKITNYSPTMSGTVSPTDTSTNFSTSIPLTWSAATERLGDGEAILDTVTYKLYYKHKTASGSYGEWTLLVDNLASNVYNWDITNIPNGYVTVAVTAYDGQEYTAILNASRTDFVADTVSNDPNGNPVVYLTTPELRILKYAAPSWSNVINDNDPTLRKSDIDQIRTEVNKLREAYNLTAYTFTDTIIAGQTRPRAIHLNELRTGANETGIAYTWLKSIVTTNDRVRGADLKEVRSFLEGIS